MQIVYSAEEYAETLKLASKIGITVAGRKLRIRESDDYKHLQNKNNPYKHKTLFNQIYKLPDEGLDNENYEIYRIFVYLNRLQLQCPNGELLRHAEERTAISG